MLWLLTLCLNTATRPPSKTRRRSKRWQTQPTKQSRRCRTCWTTKTRRSRIKSSRLPPCVTTCQDSAIKTLRLLRTCVTRSRWRGTPPWPRCKKSFRGTIFRRLMLGSQREQAVRNPILSRSWQDNWRKKTVWFRSSSRESNDLANQQVHLNLRKLRARSTLIVSTRSSVCKVNWWMPRARIRMWTRCRRESSNLKPSWTLKIRSKLICKRLSRTSRTRLMILQA